MATYIMERSLLLICFVAFLVPASSLKCYSCVDNNDCKHVTCPGDNDKCSTTALDIQSFPCKVRSIIKGCVNSNGYSKNLSISPSEATRLSMREEICETDLCNEKRISDKDTSLSDLYCHTCISPGSSCNSGNMKTMRCSGQQKQCLDLKVIGSFGEIADVNIKGCGEVPACSSRLLFTGQTSAVEVDCCGSNFCNSAIEPKEDDKSPNGVTCYSCNTFDGMGCAPTEVTKAQCYGPLTSCLEVAGLSMKDGDPTPAVIKGCATPAMCDSSILPLMLKLSSATVQCCNGTLCNNKLTQDNLHTFGYFPTGNALSGTGYNNGSGSADSAYNTAGHEGNSSAGITEESHNGSAPANAYGSHSMSPGEYNNNPRNNETSTSHNSVDNGTDMPHGNISNHNVMIPVGNNGSTLINGYNSSPGGNNNGSVYHSSYSSNSMIPNNGSTQGNNSAVGNTSINSIGYHPNHRPLWENNNGSAINESYMTNHVSPGGSSHGNGSNANNAWLYSLNNNPGLRPFENNNNGSIENIYNQNTVYNGSYHGNDSKPGSAWTNTSGHHSNTMFPIAYNNNVSTHNNNSVNPISSYINNNGSAYDNLNNLGSSWNSNNGYNMNAVPSGGNNNGSTNGNISSPGSGGSNMYHYNPNMMVPEGNHNGSAPGNGYGSHPVSTEDVYNHGNGSNHGSAWTNTNGYNSNMMHPGVNNGSTHSNYSPNPIPSSENNNGSTYGHHSDMENFGNSNNEYNMNAVPSGGNKNGSSNSSVNSHGNGEHHINQYDQNMMVPEGNHNGSAPGNGYGSHPMSTEDEYNHGNGSNLGSAWTNTNGYNSNMMHPGVNNGSTHSNYSPNPIPSSENNNGSTYGHASNLGSSWNNNNGYNMNSMPSDGNNNGSSSGNSSSPGSDGVDISSYNPQDDGIDYTNDNNLGLGTGDSNVYNPNLMPPAKYHNGDFFEVMNNVGNGSAGGNSSGYNSGAMVPGGSSDGSSYGNDNNLTSVHGDSNSYNTNPGESTHNSYGGIGNSTGRGNGTMSNHASSHSRETLSIVILCTVALLLLN